MSNYADEMALSDWLAQRPEPERVDPYEYEGDGGLID